MTRSRRRADPHATSKARCLASVARSPTSWAVLMTLTGLAAAPATGQSNPDFALDSYLAGDRPAQRISFEIDGGELEIYSARVLYPQGSSLVGFQGISEQGTPVGTFELVFDVPVPPGVDPPSVTVPLIALSLGAAWADVIADGTYSRDLEPLVRLEGPGELTVRLPFGGDADPTTLLAANPGRVTLTLLRGPLQNPEAPGPYTIATEIQSVDPDTDGADDGVAPAPRVSRFEVPIEIQPSVAIDHASLTLDGEAIGGFRVFGRFASRSLGSLAALPSAEVEVTFGNFAQTLPGEDFTAAGDGWIYVPGEGGIDRLLLRGDGRFQVDARGLELPPFVAPDQEAIPLRFSLRVNDHRVATVIAFDADGRYRP